MGQRLNIEIILDDNYRIYANCYYHWSAYTLSSLYTVKKLVDNYKENVKDKYINEPILKAVKILEIPDETYKFDKDHKVQALMVCAGLCEKSLKTMRFLYPGEDFHKATDRNVGLISIHPDEVKNTRYWQEGRSAIDFVNETFSFDMYWDMLEDDPDIKEEILYNMSDEDIANIPELPKDLCYRLMEGVLTFDDIDPLIDIIGSEHAEGRYVCKSVNLTGEPVYIQWIA